MKEKKEKIESLLLVLCTIAAISSLSFVVGKFFHRPKRYKTEVLPLSKYVTCTAIAMCDRPGIMIFVDDHCRVVLYGNEKNVYCGIEVSQ